VAPQEEGVPTKGGEFDDSVVLDGKSRSVAILALALAYAVAPTQDSFLFEGLTLVEYERLVRAAAASCGLAAWDVVPHMFRHGGASSDALAQRRNLNSIQKRGRWKGKRSVWRYEKHGLLLAQWQKVSDATRSRAASAGTLLFDALHKAFRTK
jgi:integrase